jgi:hypothetical protein
MHCYDDLNDFENFDRFDAYNIIDRSQCSRILNRTARHHTKSLKHSKRAHTAKQRTKLRNACRDQKYSTCYDCFSEIDDRDDSSAKQTCENCGLVSCTSATCLEALAIRYIDEHFAFLDSYSFTDAVSVCSQEYTTNNFDEVFDIDDNYAFMYGEFCSRPRQKANMNLNRIQTNHSRRQAAKKLRNRKRRQIAKHITLKRQWNRDYKYNLPEHEQKVEQCVFCDRISYDCIPICPLLMAIVNCCMFWLKHLPEPVLKKCRSVKKCEFVVITK